MSTKVVALLESMWGWRGYHVAEEEAPRFFRINPDNFSGRRLYQLCGTANLLVTNSCRVVQRSANHHGTPDPVWVRENFEKAQKDGCVLFLVCGRVAQRTYALTGLKFKNVLCIDHPAARRWSTETLEESRRKIARKLKGAR